MTVRVCTFAGASSLPLLVAHERGLYAAAGLDVELVETRSSDELMSGLRDRRFEIVHAAPDNFIVWRDRRDLPVLAWIGGASGPLLLMGRPGMSRVGDLRGRRIAVDAVASGFVSVLRRMLRDAGLTAEDVILEAVGATNLRAEALREGRVDATMLTLPWSAAAIRDGLPVLGDGRAAVPRMQGSCAGSLADWLAAEPDVADAYLRAVVAAVTWLQLPESRQPTGELLSRRYGIDPDLAETVRSALVDSPLGWPPSALIDSAGMATVCALRTENGDPPKSPPEAYVSLEPYRRVLGFGLLG